MKTTQPRRYLVRPNQGLLGPNGEAEIAILLVDKDKQTLLQSFDRLGQSALDYSKDKFLVQSCTVSREFAKKFSEEKAKATTADLQKELSDALTSMWNAMASGGSTPIYNKKLHVKYIAMESDVPTSTLSSPRSTNPSLAAMETMNPEQMFSELTSLRRKYDELVSFSVNLTAERDILNNTLEQAKRELHREMASRAAVENSGGVSGKSNFGRAAAKPSSSSLGKFIVIGILAFLMGVKVTKENKVGFLHSVPIVGGLVMGGRVPSAVALVDPSTDDEPDL